MRIQLSDHFTYKKLAQFTIPSIGMMIFTSIYGIVDGLFVSNFVGKTPFAAINLIMPYLMILGTFGFMIGTGGNALVSRIMGEGDRQKANEVFSLLVWVSFALGLIMTVLGIIFNAISIEKSDKLSLISYVIMGWCIVLALKPTIEALGFWGMFFVLVGGIFYTVGIIFYKNKNIRYMHSVWHLFVLAGSIFQFFSVYFWVLK